MRIQLILQVMLTTMYSCRHTQGIKMKLICMIHNIVVSQKGIVCQERQPDASIVKRPELSPLSNMQAQGA